MEQNSISSDLIRGHIDTIILYTLIDGDKFAQQISDSVEQKSDNQYKINQATLYSSLKRLETLKNVSSYMNDAGELGRRKFFRLTPQGKKVVEQNLSSWSYSKSIIDKLMDSQFQPQEKEKTVYVYLNQDKQQDVQPNFETKKDEIKSFITEPPKENHSVLEQTATPVSHSLNDEKNEVNFRSILNSLIGKQRKAEESKPQSVMVDHDVKAEAKQQSLSQTILCEEFNKTALSSGKIDFSDLKIKASKEGYKINVSSKDSAVSKNYLLINKLNFFCSIILLLLCVAEFLPIYLANKEIVDLSPLYLICFIIIVMTYPIYTLIRYILPGNISNVKLSSDSIITCTIIVFNLLLLNIAIVFLINMDLTIKANLIKFVYIPILFMLNAIVFVSIRYWLSNVKHFYKIKN